MKAKIMCKVCEDISRDDLNNFSGKCSCCGQLWKDGIRVEEK